MSALNNNKIDTIVKLNIGGKVFTTLKSTLTKYEDTMLSRLVSDDLNMKPTNIVDENGNMFFDRDPNAFKFMLQCLRTEYVPYQDEMTRVQVQEFDFWGIPFVKTYKRFYEYQFQRDEIIDRLDWIIEYFAEQLDVESWDGPFHLDLPSFSFSRMVENQYLSSPLMSVKNLNKWSIWYNLFLNSNCFRYHCFYAAFVEINAIATDEENIENIELSLENWVPSDKDKKKSKLHFIIVLIYLVLEKLIEIVEHFPNWDDSLVNSFCKKLESIFKMKVTWERQTGQCVHMCDLDECDATWKLSSNAKVPWKENKKSFWPNEDLAGCNTDCIVCKNSYWFKSGPQDEHKVCSISNAYVLSFDFSETSNKRKRETFDDKLLKNLESILETSVEILEEVKKSKPVKGLAAFT
jgi:hypothetical protein